MRRRMKTILLIIIGMLCGAVGCTEPTKNVTEFDVPEGATEIHASIADAYEGARAIVTIISDDGFYETGVNLNTILKKRNLKGTVAGVITIVKPYFDDWKMLLGDETIELVSHSYNHIRMEDGREIAQDIDALMHEIVNADKWYEEEFGYEQIVFVCPENQMCKIGYKILEENDFWAVRRGNRGFNPISPEEGVNEGEWFNLMVQGICDEGVDTSVRNGWIDTAINDGTWLIEMWHNVMAKEDGGYQTILISEAEEHLDYIFEKSEANEIWVATYSEAVKYIRERQNSNIVAYVDANELHVYVELTDEAMSYNTFNQPLTVILNMPEDMTIEEKEIVNIEGDTVMINMVPGEEAIIELFEE